MNVRKTFKCHWNFQFWAGGNAHKMCIREIQSAGYNQPFFFSMQSMHNGRALRACAPCRRVHSACDNLRPCSRCISNGRAIQCVDPVSKKRGRPKRNGASPHADNDALLFCEMMPESNQTPTGSHGMSLISPPQTLS